MTDLSKTPWKKFMADAASHSYGVYGMKKFQRNNASCPFDYALPNVRAWAAPCKESQSVEHGCFDDDKATRESVVALIRETILS